MDRFERGHEMARKKTKNCWYEKTNFSNYYFIADNTKIW